MLHVHCGDSSADQLRESDLPGEVMVWADPLCEGPTPADLDASSWRDCRARYLAEATRGAVPVEQARQWLTQQDAALARSVEHDEVVLWFDACMFDQIILIRQLAWFAEHPRSPGRLSLVCIGEFPGFARFTGLGELDPGRLASLFPGRRPVTEVQLALAQEAWMLFRSPDPAPLEQFIGSDLSALPYVADALHRHLEEFPSTRNGLGRLANECLDVVAGGQHHPGNIFRLVSAMEARPFFGDTTLFACLNHLAEGEHRALHIDGTDVPNELPVWDPPKDLSPWSFTIGNFGRQLRRGDADWPATNGLDRWLGGVHLASRHPPWRWDEDAGALVCYPAPPPREPGP